MKLIFLWAAAAFVVGFAIGQFVFFRRVFRKTDGQLSIIREETEEETTERYSLNFETPLDDVPRKKFVIFKVHATSRKKSSPL